MTLTGKQKRHLRALGHELQVVLQLGKEGSTEAVVAAADVQLTAHELIKVRLGRHAPEDREQVAGELAAATESEVAQILGNTFLLYRAHPDKPKIQLPAAGGR